MHPENVEDQKLFDGILQELQDELIVGKGEVELNEMDNFKDFEKIHRKIVDQWR